MFGISDPDLVKNIFLSFRNYWGEPRSWTLDNKCFFSDIPPARPIRCSVRRGRKEARPPKQSGMAKRMEDEQFLGTRCDVAAGRPQSTPMHYQTIDRVEIIRAVVLRAICPGFHGGVDYPILSKGIFSEVG